MVIKSYGVDRGHHQERRYSAPDVTLMQKINVMGRPERDPIYTSHIERLIGAKLRPSATGGPNFAPLREESLFWPLRRRSHDWLDKSTFKLRALNRSFLTSLSPTIFSLVQTDTFEESLRWTDANS